MSIGRPGRIGLLRTIIWVMASLAGKQKDLPQPKKQSARPPACPRPALRQAASKSAKNSRLFDERERNRQIRPAPAVG